MHFSALLSTVIARNVPIFITTIVADNIYLALPVLPLARCTLIILYLNPDLTTSNIRVNVDSFYADIQSMNRMTQHPRPHDRPPGALPAPTSKLNKLKISIIMISALYHNSMRSKRSSFLCKSPRHGSTQ